MLKAVLRFDEHVSDLHRRGGLLASTLMNLADEPTQLRLMLWREPAIVEALRSSHGELPAIALQDS
jgi:hypothetical protein